MVVEFREGGGPLEEPTSHGRVFRQPRLGAEIFAFPFLTPRSPAETLTCLSLSGPPSHKAQGTRPQAPDIPDNLIGTKCKSRCCRQNSATC